MDPAILDRALAGDLRALGRVLSWVERRGADGRAVIERVHPRAGRARVWGLTGPPGVGKSTLSDRLTSWLRARGRKVGVVAVDPTSPFSGGAILGDRIRLVQHFTDPGVFIRSMATRGHLGGLAPATADAIDVLDAAGYDVILVETIGVGQDDIEVTRLAEVVLLVTTPGLGDEIQTMKGGIMEAGDVYVINKADLPGADRVEAALFASLAMAGLEESRPIVRVTATAGEGIDELAAAIDRFEEGLGEKGRAGRRELRARERLRGIVMDALLERVKQGAASEERWQAAVARVAARELSPYSAADELLRGAQTAEESR